MEERVKCKKRPDLQYYKPPILLNKPSSKEEDMPEDGKKVRDMLSPNIRESIVITTHRRDVNSGDKNQGFARRTVQKQNFDSRQRRSTKNEHERDSKSHECNGDSNLDPKGENCFHHHRPDSYNHVNHHKGGKTFDMQRRVSTNLTQSPHNASRHHNRPQHNSQRNPETANLHDEPVFENSRSGRKLPEKDLRFKPNETRVRESQRDSRNHMRFVDVNRIRTPEIHQEDVKANCNIPPHIEEVQSSGCPNHYCLNVSSLPPHSSSTQDQLLSQASSSPSSSPPVLQPKEPMQPLSKMPHSAQYNNTENHDFERKDSRPTINTTRDQVNGNLKPRWNSQDDQQKPYQLSHHNHTFDRKQNKKFNPRNEQKAHGENLPPRFKKKILMEKMANRNQGHQFDPSIINVPLAPDFYQHQHQHQQDQINRGIGQIPNNSPHQMGLRSYHHPDSLASQRDLKNHVDSHGEYSRHDQSRFHHSNPAPEQKQQQIIPNSANIIQSTNFLHRQLYDHSATTKPCVLIRPIPHNHQTNNPQNRCMVAPGMMPVQVPGTGHAGNLHPQFGNECINNLAYMKQWSRQFCQISPNEKRIPLSPSNVMLHYLPNYSSPPLNSNHQLESPLTGQATNLTPDSNMQSKRKIVENLMNEISQLDKDLQKELQKYPEYDERTINPLRVKMQSRYRSIIRTDPKFCSDKNVESMLWKSVFYQFIELRQKEIEKDLDSQSSKDELLKLVEEANVFYETLLVFIQDDFDFSIDDYIDHQYDSGRPNSELIKYASHSIQKIYLYLGELSQFREQISVKPNYNKARNFFIKAQQIAPSNGLPYNQLAVLAMLGRRRLDAVYNYMRSLASECPDPSARQSLLQIFEEVRNKYESIETTQVGKKLSSIVINTASDENCPEARPDEIVSGKSCSDQALTLRQELPEKELDLLNDIDLNKRFILSFLHVHGKLFTKVGLDSFESVVDKMFSELKCILRRSPFPMSSQRLVQLMAINLFSVYQLSSKEVSATSEKRVLLREKAIDVTFSMVCLFLERIENSLEKESNKELSALVSDDVEELLPAIKIWTDWMSYQMQIWSLPLMKAGFFAGSRGDVWSLFARVLNKLGELNLESVKLQPSRLNGFEQITLPEDTLLSGFIPLFGAQCASAFIQPPYDKEEARTCLRIDRINFFGKFLCDLPEKYIVYDLEKKRYISLGASGADKSKIEGSSAASDVKEIYCS